MQSEKDWLLQEYKQQEKLYKHKNEHKCNSGANTDQNGFSILQYIPFLSCLFSNPNLDNDYYPLDQNYDRRSKKTKPPHDQDSRRWLDAKNKLLKVRKLMKKHGIGVYIVPSEDAHQSERTADIDKRLEFVSNFTGGTGVGVITLDNAEDLTGRAALSTDGRFFLQADLELDPDFWIILKQNTVGYPSWTEFAVAEANANEFSKVISCDPRLISHTVGQQFHERSREAGNSFKFEPLIEVNLVDEVWGDEKPPLSSNPIYHLKDEYSGETAASKLKRVRKKMKSLGGTHLLLTALDEIAWLFNLRCDGDFEFTPLFHANAVITITGATIYVDEKKINRGRDINNREISVDRMDAKEAEFLVIKPYYSFYSDISTFKSVGDDHVKLIVPQNANYALVSSIAKSELANGIIYNSVVSYLKIYKNKTELSNYAKAQFYDSIAFIIFISWLEHELVVKKSIITEYEAACKLYSIRKQNSTTFKGHSNAAISSSGPNSSIIHYAPTEDSNSLILPDAVYLVDSGAQYLEGTTDITRTFRFTDEDLEEDRKYYTLVLKGHLAVSMAKFPAGTYTGAMLDGFSREPLWEEGLDFNHGTGHGIASFGNIHEGPLFISTTSQGPNKEDIFREGGLLTIEPGYYIDRVKGYRIESEIEIVKTEDKDRLGKGILAFKYLTKIPFCRKLVDKNMLSEHEIAWINDYYSSIRNECGHELRKRGEMEALRWLMRETEPI